MSEVTRLRTRAEIDEEAAVWAWRMDSGCVSAADRQAHEAWLRQDPRHGRAFRELSNVWRTMDALAEAKRDEKIATFVQSAPHKRGRHVGVWAAAAAVLLVSAALFAFWVSSGSELQTLATAVGQERAVTLADGSVVSLNTNTIVETDLRRGSRNIYLRKGEAHFQVAHDASRPFLVHAGDAVVRAVGTAFEVRVLADQHVDVVVDEGRVEVRATPPAQTRAAPTAMRAVLAGERLSTRGDFGVTVVSRQQLSSGLAWREGAVVFDGQRLSEAVAEVERYTDTRITISDPSSASLRVGGRFRTGDLQEFFDALEAALPVQVHQTATGVVIDPL